jgi:soluble lytic murein transglycosylase-like protein
MEQKEIRITIVNLSLWLAIFGLVVSMFSLGFVFGRATEAVAQEIEVVTEEVSATDIYSEDVPLSEQDQRALYAASEEFGVDYYVMLGLIEQETDFRNISGDGGNASGYCQIWKHWWGDLMTDIGAEDLNEPKDNFRTACAIVAELTEKHGSVAGALTAYNKGSYDGTVSKYAAKVLENAEAWRNRKNLL